MTKDFTFSDDEETDSEDESAKKGCIAIEQEVCTQLDVNSLDEFLYLFSRFQLVSSIV